MRDLFESVCICLCPIRDILDRGKHLPGRWQGAGRGGGGWGEGAWTSSGPELYFLLGADHAYLGLVIRGVRKMGTYLVRTYLRYVPPKNKTYRFGVIGATDHGQVTGSKMVTWQLGKSENLET